jgi:arylsulfatase A-like enzyme
VLLVSALACTREQPRSADERSSVLFVLVDALRADYVGAWGFPGPISPCLDGLAGESVRFARAFSQAPWTKPSIATLFTSLYPQVHGVTNHKGGLWGAPGAEGQIGILPERAVTLAELFRAGGYETAGFVGNPWLDDEYGFAQGFDVWDDSFAETHVEATVVLDAARAWLDSRRRDRPFFLYLHFMDVHGPYAAPDEDYLPLRGSLGDFGHRLSPEEFDKIPKYLRRPEWSADDSARDVVTWRERYGAGVRSFDRLFCEFLSGLRADGTLDRASVWVTSDHGEELHEHGGWAHGHALYEHQTHVPLLVRLPGGSRGGRVVSEIVNLIDLMPTLLRQAGLGVPDDLQGRDLSPLLDGRALADATPRAISSASFKAGVHALREERYKLVLDTGDGSVRLFDLVSDPGERTDAAAANPEVVRSLRRPLDAYLAELTARGAFAVSTADADPKLQERLKALGYVE